MTLGPIQGSGPAGEQSPKASPVTEKAAFITEVKNWLLKALSQK